MKNELKDKIDAYLDQIKMTTESLVNLKRTAN